MDWVLVVDDDEQNRELVASVLKKENIKITELTSGKELLDYIEGMTPLPDLILLDYDMPVTDGPQVLKMIHGEPGSSDIPVMFLTGRSDKKSIMKVLSLKPAGYLLKSIDRNTLLETLDNYFLDQMMKDSE